MYEKRNKNLNNLRISYARTEKKENSIQTLRDEFLKDLKINLSLEEFKTGEQQLRKELSKRLLQDKQLSL